MHNNFTNNDFTTAKQLNINSHGSQPVVNDYAEKINPEGVELIVIQPL